MTSIFGLSQSGVDLIDRKFATERVGTCSLSPVSMMVRLLSNLSALTTNRASARVVSENSTWPSTFPFWLK